MDRRLVVIVAFLTLLATSCTRSIPVGDSVPGSGGPTATTAAPDSTPAVATAAPSIAPPTAAPFTLPPDDPTTRYDYRDVPQLGTELVRGTGCGADGSLGDVVPDGWWYGIPSEWEEEGDSFEFDVVCVYYGDSARRLIEECLAGPDGELCSEFPADFWIVNDDETTRLVPVASDVEIVNPNATACPDYDPRSGSYYVLIHIVDGQTTYVSAPCPGE